MYGYARDGPPLVGTTLAGGSQLPSGQSTAQSQYHHDLSGTDYVQIDLQPALYGLSHSHVPRYEAFFNEEKTKRLRTQKRRRVRRLLLALIGVTVSLVVMIIVYSIILSSRDYYNKASLQRRNWWWNFFKRKLSQSDQRAPLPASSDEDIEQSPGSGSVDKPSEAGADIVGRTWFTTCENSKQGRTYITDERGYTCRWDHMYSGQGYGCCWESDRTNISRYSCQQCDLKTSCCLDYEFCVSCCMNPSQERRVEEWLNSNGEPHEKIAVQALSRFERCLALCRTSSASVLRQHLFISPNHFCYAAAAPPASPYR